jgi:hypothetical protein
MPAEYQDLLIHNVVRWLSKGKFLERFINLKDEITKFLKFSSNKNATKWKLLLQDDDFMANVCFLSDIFSHLNALNEQL